MHHGQANTRSGHSPNRYPCLRLQGDYQLTSTLDIYRSAHGLIKQHGDDAAIEAAMRADELLDKGDVDGCAVWKRILIAVKEIQRGELNINETLH